MSRLRAINNILELAHAVEERRRRILSRQRRANRLLRASIDPFIAMTNEEFVKTFRLSKEAVRELEVELRPHLHLVRRDSLTVMHNVRPGLFHCGYCNIPVTGWDNLNFHLNTPLHNCTKMEAGRKAHEIFQEYEQQERLRDFYFMRLMSLF